MGLRENIENSVVIWLLGTLLTGFLAGIGAYKAVLEVAKYEVISKADLDQLKRNAEQPPKPVPSERIIPPDVSKNLIRDKPPWVALLVNLLDTEGAVEKNGFGSPNPKLHFGVDAIEYQLTKASKSFSWSLSTDSSYTIVGRAFRAIPDGLIQPLDQDTSDTGRRVTFSVPECNQGDRLIAVVRVKWTHDLPVEDITSTFQSSSK
jgi:hypothetical protein